MDLKVLALALLVQSTPEHVVQPCLECHTSPQGIACLTKTLEELSKTFNICYAMWGNASYCRAGVEEVLGLYGESWSWRNPYFHTRDIPYFCRRIYNVNE